MDIDQLPIRRYAPRLTALGDKPSNWYDPSYAAPVSYSGIIFPTVSHAWAAARTSDTRARRGLANEPIENLRASTAELPIRPGWDNVSVAALDALMRQRFAPGTDQLTRLLGEPLPILHVGPSVLWSVDPRTWTGRNTIGLLTQTIVEEAMHGQISPPTPEPQWEARQRALLTAVLPGIAPLSIDPAETATAGRSPTYAGIGSRKTPPQVLQLMRDAGRRLATLGWLLRSGAADGADNAFEAGALASAGAVEIYLPWPKFNSHRSPLAPPSADAYQMAAAFHPRWHILDDNARALQARNCHQVLGRTLDDPDDIVLCWTPGGALQGGTAQALRIAEAYEIPVINLGRPGAPTTLPALMAEIDRQAIARR